MTTATSRATKERALVTGAAGGIGRAVAQALLARGAEVIAVDIDESRLRDAFGTDAAIVAADLGDDGARDEVAMAAEGVDSLVNAAGILRLKPIAEVTVEEYRDIMRINAESTFFLCQKVGPTMPSGSAMVNLSSASAKLAITVEAAVYAASKAAILSMTRSFAYSFAHIPVRVNAVCPGIIETSMQTQLLDRVSAARNVSIEELRREREAAIPMGRTGTPEELADFICFLLSAEAGYITGQAINFDGGMITW